MQLNVTIKLGRPLVLPINYQHILQAVIYNSLSRRNEYSTFVHDKGYAYEKRKFRMFTFSELEGKYEIREWKIIFRNSVRFEIRSPEVLFIQNLAQSFRETGIRFGENWYKDVAAEISDDAIEEEEIYIRMKTPICVYSTDLDTKKTYFYAPDEVMFYQMIIDNFVRKYQACYGVEPDEEIEIVPVEITGRDKFVTKYKNFYISGWRGVYRLSGKRKYLDFLYQTGLGSKNSQGFGMFEVI